MRHLLNKRFCRKFSDPNLRFPKGCGILHCEQIKYVIRTAIKNIGGKRTLVLYLFSTEQAAKGTYKPTYVMFQTKEDFLTLENMADGSIRWRESALHNFKRDMCFSSKCAFYRSSDEEKVIKFCNGGEKNGFNALYFLQNALQTQKWKERNEKKQVKVLRQMKKVPALPRGLKSFVHKSVLPQYIFYSYKRTKKPIEGYCTACGHTVMITGQKHCKDGICPRCNHKIKFKSRGRRMHIFDRNTVQVVQRTDTQELVIRIIKVYNDYIDCDIPKYSCFESARIFISWSHPNHAEETWYYNNYYGSITPWIRGMRPRWFPYQYYFLGDHCAYLYEKNLDQELFGTPWQYSQMKQFSLGIQAPLELAPYFQTYFQYPVLEYLVKLRLYNLAGSMIYQNDWNHSNPPINIHGTNHFEVLGIRKEHIPLMQKTNPSAKYFSMLKDLIVAGKIPDAEFAKWCIDHKITDGNMLNTILKHISMYKLRQYAMKQYGKFKRISWNDTGKHYTSMNNLLIEYRDYLVMAEGLEYDLRNDFVLFPNNLPDAHNRADDLTKKREQVVYDKLISAAYPSLSAKYSYEKAGLMIVPPRSAKEIVDEGHFLHHCVGAYVERVTKGETTILFIRKTDDPDTPLCTVELRNDEIKQARIYNNQDPPPNIRSFIAEWNAKLLAASALATAA